MTIDDFQVSVVSLIGFLGVGRLDMYPTVWTTLIITTSVPKSGCSSRTASGIGDPLPGRIYRPQVGFLRMYVYESHMGLAIETGY